MLSPTPPRSDRASRAATPGSLARSGGGSGGVALERTGIDRKNRLVRVSKRFSGGELKQGTKTVPERFVPLRQRALDVLDKRAPRIDTRILFPAPRVGYIDVERFRHRE